MIVISVDRENGENLSIGGVTINANLITLIEANDSDIELEYGWSSSNTIEPSSYQTATLNKESEFKRTAELETRVGEAGNYYLWIKAKLKNKETKKTYGVYGFKVYSCLRKNEGSVGPGSNFLANTYNIKRSKIKNIVFVRGTEGYDRAAGYWDVSAQKNGEILAWYNQDGDYYNVWIGAKDGDKVIANDDSGWIFGYLGGDLPSGTNAKIEGLNNLDTRNVTNMFRMFAGSSKIKELDLSGFNTKNVTTMHEMFLYCRELTNLNLSGWNTKNVTDMSWMFDGCTLLSNLDVSSFDTSNVTDMFQMFDGCESLTSLNLSNFNTENVLNMRAMFYGCKGLTYLNLNGFNNKKLTNMILMFARCENLESLDLKNFSTSNLTDMAQAFLGCKKLTNLNLSGFNTSNVTDMNSMFMNCESLESLDLSSFNTTNVTNMEGMFFSCHALTTIYVSNKFVTTNVTSGTSMFSGCYKLIGGNGTTCNGNNNTGIEYARIDTAETPGYFTLKTN